ncbi:MAG TPA: hypothetical protein VNH11_25000 [Pirellulales bacterium]|nr:hypothetical protein [Pirellulales bacterium]
MTFFRTRLSAAVAWVMIPLAAWAGMPSTACLCANGHVKLFCQHLPAKKHSAANQTACAASCCAHETADAEADCCGGGFCCHGGQSDHAGIGSKACCKPILSAPSVAPQIVSVPCDQAPAVVAVVQQVGALVHPSFIVDAAEFDSGPPLDRVIVFRSLLI